MVLLLSGTKQAYAQCSLPYTISNGDPADATKLMANFNALIGCLSPGGSTNAIQYKAGSNLGGVGPLTNGQVVIGSTGNAPRAQTLTAGTGIAIANGPGTIAVTATGGINANGLYRQVMSATSTAASTGLMAWLNQGSATVADTAVGLSVDAPSTGTTLNVTGRFASVPATPYTITALIAATRNSTSYSGVGIGWYDGTAKLHLIGYGLNNGGAQTIGVGRFTNVTTYASTDFASAVNAFSQPIWLQIKDDGTTISFAFSQDGSSFITVYSVAKSSSFLGAGGYSNLFFYVDPRGGRTVGTIMSWTQS